MALFLIVGTLVLMVAATLPAAASPAPIDVESTADNGVGNSRAPGRSCDDGGSGAYWHYDYGTDLPQGTLGDLPVELRTHLDLHSDIVRQPNTSGATPPAPESPSAFLQGIESHASFLTDRGTVKIRLSSGDCETPTLGFDGSIASGTGTWTVDRGTGAYREATGSGVFDLTAEVNPGADNTLSLDLNGDLDILEPELQSEVVSTYWGGLGVDYVSRRVTVVYEITNVGPGDAYGVVLDAAGSPTSGVGDLGPAPQGIGDLLAGQSAIVQVRYQLGLLNPCLLVLLGCDFDSSLELTVPDALDRPTAVTLSNEVEAPTLPPPL
ncbi:hypothetical protein [Actinospongicola halichondriae]|uniref:hypothetical protein n=1 Tax=Actinospongicola halichondriae TaxID=3236844 RepID=UPI003D38B33F